MALGPTKISESFRSFHDQIQKSSMDININININDISMVNIGESVLGPTSLVPKALGQDLTLTAVSSCLPAARSLGRSQPQREDEVFLRQWRNHRFLGKIWNKFREINDEMMTNYDKYDEIREFLSSAP